jgi:hypothetical protein
MTAVQRVLKRFDTKKSFGDTFFEIRKAKKFEF